MPDTTGMNEIRGIDIDKLVKGFADEELTFKSLTNETTTSAREIRWYQKTAGFLTAPTTTGMTSNFIENTDQLAQPVVIEASWTRNTSYVKKFFAESPMISMEDIKDSDVDVLGTNLRDIVRAVAKRVDVRIWNVITENQSAVNINAVTSTAAWDAASGQDPVEDISEAIQKIQEDSYDTTNAVLLVSPKDYKSLVVWLISTKGTSIPNFSSELVKSGSAIKILGLSVRVSNNVTADYAAVVVPQRAATWKAFMPITSAVIEEKGIGSKIRVWEEGECLLTDPNAVSLISNTQL